MDNVSFSVGDVKELLSVDLPCFVKSNDLAVKCLGGHDILQSNLENGTSLQFRFPNQDSLSHNLTSSSINKGGILLKIRRKKVPVNDDHDISVEIVGCVKKSLVFNNPADYKFLPSSSNVNHYSMNQVPSEKQILEVVPQTFTRYQDLDGYQFLNLTDNLKWPDKTNNKSVWQSTAPKVNGNMKLTSSANAEDISDVDADGANSDSERKTSDKASNSKRKKQHPDAGLTAYIRFGDPIPQKHPSGDHPLRWSKGNSVNYRGLQIIAQLRQIFSVIPMLTRQQLKGMINLQRQHQYLFTDCLPYVAYCYSQGPFKSLWVRFGYDPLQNPESRFFQFVNFRLSPIVFQDVSKQIFNFIGTERSANKIVDLDNLTLCDSSAGDLGLAGKAQYAKVPFAMFGLVMRHQFAVQMCLLSDENVFAFVQRMKPQSVCCDQSGWYTSSAIAGLRNLVLKTMSDRINMFLAQELVVVKGSINHPVHQAYMSEFDELKVRHYLQADSNTLESEGIKHPCYLLYWLKRYLDGSHQQNYADFSHNRNLYDDITMDELNQQLGVSQPHVDTSMEVDEGDDGEYVLESSAAKAKGKKAVLKKVTKLKTQLQRNEVVSNAPVHPVIPPKAVNFANVLPAVQAYDVFGGSDDDDVNDDDDDDFERNDNSDEGENEENHEDAVNLSTAEQYFDPSDILSTIAHHTNLATTTVSGGIDSSASTVSEEVSNFMDMVHSFRKPK